MRGPARGSRFILGSLAGEGGGATVYLGMVEPEQSRTISQLLRRGGVFFDVGANVGYYSVLASRIVGETGLVVAIEPDIRNISFLYRHRMKNRLRNVSIVTAACSDRSGLCTFSTGSTFATGHLSDRTPDVRLGQSSLVPTISLDSLAERIERFPDVVKIDVEGAELSVLQGASNTLAKRRPVIVLSTHSESLRSECLSFLAVLGYESRPLKDGDTNPTEHLAIPSGSSV